MTVEKPSHTFFEALATFRTVKTLALRFDDGSGHGFYFINSHAFASIANLSNLRNLRLKTSAASSAVGSSVPTKDWLQLFKGLPKLGNLIVDFTPAIDITTLKNLGSSCQELWHLSIADTLDFTLVQDEKKCLFPSLRILQLHEILLIDLEEKDMPKWIVQILDTIAPKLESFVSQGGDPVDILTNEAFLEWRDSMSSLALDLY
ncbi:hypothetical protein K470DRAFT_287196 [Piedraia hortae CBS 480.64]|uniref:F-box domain-containing protein n=1 Tax=Piedraia hortae CBS 480.64 TaxID=1314780 RepID=A0A6A7C986_9PEZI|nr:hypothetical protein K470DRAFT_287196 [Piedraia hortae CBS 480.64]